MIEGFSHVGTDHKCNVCACDFTDDEGTSVMYVLVTLQMMKVEYKDTLACCLWHFVLLVMQACMIS